MPICDWLLDRWRKQEPIHFSWWLTLRCRSDVDLPTVGPLEHSGQTPFNVLFSNVRHVFVMLQLYFRIATIINARSSSNDNKYQYKYLGMTPST